MSSGAKSSDSVSPFEYVPIEGVERLECYRPGGYHPISIGHILHNRYKVVHKLGYGTYSTTWLAHDESCQKYVAIKVGTANSNSKEAGILRALADAKPPLREHPGRAMILPLQDKFELHGPNGTHPCYVTSPGRTSISGAKDGSYIRLFQRDTARALAAQIALAVAYTHAQGFAHGDLHLGNILLRLPNSFSQLSIAQLYKKYGEPDAEPIVRIDGQPLPRGVPRHVTAPVWLGESSESITLPDSGIFLSDFGEAFKPSKELRHICRTPISIAPPETRFEPQTPISFSSDIWTLACAIWTILGQRPLFESFLATQDDITVEQVDALGKLPPEWWEKWQTRREWFSETGEPKKGRHFRSWADRFKNCIEQPRLKAGMAGFDMEEKMAVLNMLRSMLEYRPEKRLTAKQVLECEWMVKWALPEFKKAQRS